MGRLTEKVAIITGAAYFTGADFIIDGGVLA
jgi:hypothetical protein